MACDVLAVGVNTDVRAYRMNGNCDELGNIPSAGYFSITNGAAAAAKGATAIVPLALPADVYAGNYLQFVDMAGGIQSLAFVNTDANTTDTSLVVDALPEAVAAGAVAQWPPFLGGRNTASVNQSGNTVSTLNFEDGLFTRQALTSISSDVQLSGNFLDTDAGMWTFYDAFTRRQAGLPANLFILITLTAQRAGSYSKGSQWAFQVVPTGANMSLETEGIVTFDFTGVARGRCILDLPVPN